MCNVFWLNIIEHNLILNEKVYSLLKLQASSAYSTISRLHANTISDEPIRFQAVLTLETVFITSCDEKSTSAKHFFSGTLTLIITSLQVKKIVISCRRKKYNGPTNSKNFRLTEQTRCRKISLYPND